VWPERPERWLMPDQDKKSLNCIVKVLVFSPFPHHI
jgi:hypothetical protein